MASSGSSGYASPRRRGSTNNLAGNKDEADLSHSLKQLSLARSSPAKSPLPSPRPSPSRAAISRSPSVASNRGAPRSPLNGTSASSGRDSRSATPTLLRKASLNSLHSASGVAPPRRASSVNLMSPTSWRSPLSGLTPEVEEKPAPTAASIANAYFKSELDVHHGEHQATPAETVVILHDSCYGHRYSRPRTSRAALSTIVERPERIRASVLGVSLAYVRLGERHADGLHPIHPRLNPASIPSIPFRIHKTTRKLPLTSQTVTHVHGAKWMEELKMMCESAESKLAANGKELQRPEVHRGPGEETPGKLHEGDLYLCAESLDALEGSLGGVCEAVDAVFRPSGPKRAFVAIRPPGHHCSAAWPSGFCWINNVHVGIMHAILSHGLTHAAIIDFDLHHGDGSQSIAWQHNSRGVGLGKNAAWWKKSSIGYFSLHDINSYPCEMGDEDKVRNASICIDNAHGQTVWNVHLEPWKSEAEFWELYETKYSVLLDKTRKFLRAQTERVRASSQACKGAIFLSAGFDASEWESSGMQRHNVNVPTEFYARLTRDVVKIAAEEGTSVEGRVVSVLEGGYSDRALFSGILSHLGGLAGEDAVPTREEDYNGLGYEMGQRMGTTRDRRESLSVKKTARPYEPSWWAINELERMEATVAPPPTSPAPKRQQPLTPPTYSSPTQASTARVVRTPKVRRSMSSLSMGPSSPLSRPPSPPPPDVPWTVAAHELSKLLIPSDRETGSCTAEDLSAEATRARRDRQSMASQQFPPETTPEANTSAPTRVSMRERKQVKPFGSIDEEEEDRKNRRRTVAGPAVLSTEKAPLRGSTPNPPGRPKQPGRRLSAASTIGADSGESEVPFASSTNGSTRPTTAQSVRPGSSASGGTTNGAPLAVRKSRVVNVKKEAPPKAPKTTRKPTATEGGKTTAQAPAAAPAGQTITVSTGPAADDMDKLTNGMKKIKINVVTAAQKEAREKAKKETTPPVKEENKEPVKAFKRTPSASPVRAPAAGTIPSDRVVRAAATQPVPAQQQVPSAAAAKVPSGPSTPNLVAHRFPPPQDVPLPASSPVLPSTPTLRLPPAQGAAPDVFVRYQPDGPSPEALPQTQPLQWLPVNNGTTPSPMKRGEMPVFTSTSPIPFATLRRAAEGEGPLSPKSVTTGRIKAEGKEESVWDIPDSPSK